MPASIYLQAEAEVWERLRRALLHRERLKNYPLVVVAAHPDDETIGASLLLAQAEKSMVVFLTRGVPRDRALWPPEVTGSDEDYANLRRQEAIQALSWAGVSEERIFPLGGIDQEAIFEASQLAARLGTLVRELKPRALITHPYEGGHPDHDAAALIARLARARADSPPALIEMTSYHAREGRSVSGEFLESAACGEIALELASPERKRKVEMLAAYRSQHLVLSSFSSDRERLRPAPNYDFEKPPHPGRLWYEQMGWPLAGERWRELARSAQLEEAPCRSPY